jgi:hypothetical protein
MVMYRKFREVKRGMRRYREVSKRCRELWGGTEKHGEVLSGAEW